MDRADPTDPGLMAALRNHWFVAILAFGACMLLGAAAAYLPGKRYHATSTVSVKPNLTVVGSAAVQTADFLIPTLLEQVETRTFADRARSTLPPSVATVPVKVEAEVKEEGTGVVRITVDSSQAEVAASWANALAQLLVTEESAPASAMPPPVAAPVPAQTGIPQPVLTLSIIEPAEVPSSPATPQQQPLLLGAAVLGLFAAIFAARAASRAELSSDLDDQVRTRLGTSVLSQIPYTRPLRRGPATVDRLFTDARPELLEAFKVLRVNVALLAAETGLSTVVVSSVLAREGKSTITAGLGWSLASVGHDVCLIDGDLRQPALHLRMGSPGAPGLADVTEDDPSSLLRRTAIDNLSFLPAGVPAQHPADVVAATFPTAVAHLSRPGRLLVVDSPPLGLAAESLQVAAVAEHVILVVEAKSFRMRELEQLVERLRGSGIVILGLVVNKVRRRPLKRRSAYSRYGVQSSTLDAPELGGQRQPARLPVASATQRSSAMVTSQADPNGDGGADGAEKPAEPKPLSGATDGPLLIEGLAGRSNKTVPREQGTSAHRPPGQPGQDWRWVAFTAWQWLTHRDAEGGGGRDTSR